jgi:outer membrane immunogenic protein
MPTLRPASAYALAALACTSAPLAAQSWSESYRRSQAGAPAYAGARRSLDGSLKDGAYSPTPPPSRPDIWTGLYAGIHGGGGFGSLGSSLLVDGDVPTSGGLIGGHVGYNIQMGAFVAGLEVDGGWAGIGGDNTFTAAALSSNIGWLSSTRGRIGYAWDNWLVYATGGLALAGQEVTASSIGANAVLSDTLVGYAVGGGVEMKLSQHVSARLEALHYGFGDSTMQAPQGTLRIDPDVTTVRAGLTFHWN